jgi:hypothetical protein
MTKTKKSKIPEPTRLDILERNKKKYDRLINHYHSDLKRLEAAIEIYKNKSEDLQYEIRRIIEAREEKDT